MKKVHTLVQRTITHNQRCTKWGSWEHRSEELIRKIEEKEEEEKNKRTKKRREKRGKKEKKKKKKERRGR